MKILLIHNFYQQFGGEDAVALAERQLLENYGNEVFSYTRHNNEIKGYDALDKLGLIFHTIYSRRTKREISDIARVWKPDVAYIHNVYPLISPSVYHTLWSLKIPIIQVVHDFRPFCPNGWFFTRGRVCERCKWGNYFHAIRYRCHRNSYLTSTLYSATMAINRLADMVRRIDAFVCLTPFARDKLLGIGIPPSKVFVRPNWVETTMGPALGRGDYVAYLGRLSSEKGLWTLVRAFERLDSIMLKIAGTGPLGAALKSYLQRKAIKNVMMVGFKGGEEKWDLLANSLFTVVPSEWYENFPLVVLEAYAAGKPVVGSRLGSLPYIIEENKSGILFEPGCVDDLVKKVSYLLDRPDEVDRMGRHARSLAESTYSPAACYQRLMGIFSTVCGSGERDSIERRHSAPGHKGAEVPTEKTTKVLIGIVTTNQIGFVAQCLDSVPANAKHNSLKVILVDNCSSDGAAEIVRDRYPWVEVVQRECNYSFAANNNVAFARYPSEYFLMLNPDTVLGEGAVDTLVRFMEDHPDCGACGPRLVFPNGSLQHSCRRFPTVWSTLLRRSPIRLLLPGDRRGARHLMVSVPHDHEMQVDWMLGACILVRRGAIEGTKLLDEGFPLYCDDIDLCRRLKKGGWTTYYVPSTTVIHHHLAKSDSELFCRESYLHAMSIMHFIGKHYLSLQPDTAESSGVRIREP